MSDIKENRGSMLEGRDMSSRNGACAVCWAGNHACVRDVDGWCRPCALSRMNRPLEGDVPGLRFPRDEVLYHISNVTLSLNASNLECYVWDINLELPNATNTGFEVVSFDMLEDTHDEVQMASLDDWIMSKFSTALDIKEGDPAMFYNAKLASGYTYCLLSPTAPSKHVRTIINDVDSPTFHENIDLAAIFKCKMLLRLGGIIEVFMARLQLDNSSTVIGEAAKNHAAAVVLLHEVGQMYDSLRRGILQNLFPAQIANILMTWFESQRGKLVYKVRNGCGKFLVWNNPIKGALKQLKLRHCKPKTRMTVNLQQRLRFSLDPGSSTTDPPGLSLDHLGKTPSESAVVFPATPPSISNTNYAGFSDMQFGDYTASNMSFPEVSVQDTPLLSEGSDWFDPPPLDDRYEADYDALFGAHSYAHWANQGPGEFVSHDGMTSSDPQPTCSKLS